MIIATAGHVDHGKSALIKALTGGGTDRLPEERRRGLTIEPGFSYIVGPEGQTLGFVDVPGHERFVANMLAGVAAIDYVLLVVAADDGVMPQTREHLAIIDLLGVRSGAVVISKLDRVDQTRVRDVANEIAGLLEGTSLAGSPVHEVSAVGGIGVEALRVRLWSEALRHVRLGGEGRFRLSIDRSFSVAGAGLVVTGAVVSGSVGIGEHLRLSPSGRRVRVRDIRVHGRASARANRGDRAALNLVGDRVDREQALRGAWVLDEALHAPTRNLDAYFRLLPTASKPVRHWVPVHVHLAAGHVTGRLALLGTDVIQPGAAGFVELILNEPVGALSGDRFVVRDQSARFTLGGGFVANPFAPSRGRMGAGRRASAIAMANADSRLALMELLEIEGHEVDLERFAVARDLRPEDAERMYRDASVRVFDCGAGRNGISSARWSALQKDVLDALGETHRRSPNQLGIRERDLAGLLASRPSGSLFRALLSELVVEWKVARTGPWYHLAGHRPCPSPSDLSAWRRIERHIEMDGLRAPSLGVLAVALDENPPELAKTLHRLEGLGFLVGVAKNRFLTLRQVACLGRLAEQLANADEGRGESLTASAFREKAGIGRNLAIEVLEYFDRLGLTRRIREYRRIQRKTSEIFGQAES